MSSFRLIFGIVLVSLSTSSPQLIGGDHPATDQALISRGRLQLNLAGAEAVIAAAKQKASALKAKMNIAVVDDGGQMLAFARMDGARPASAATALTKAVSAATFRQETGPLSSGGKITALKGGVPIVVEGQVIGGVGIAGGTGEQDAEVAKAAYQSLLAALGGRK
jgi:glc operon protein GlcG